MSTKVQQLVTVVEEDEALFLGEYLTQAEDSWIPIYDEVVRDDNNIEDLDLGVSSIELDVCGNLLIDIIILSATPSDKVLKREVSAVNFTIHKISTDVPSQE